jgi:toxin ParE1/3/4
VRAALLKGSLFLSDYAGIVALLADANPDAADRFCDAVEAGLDLLVQHPEIGSLAGFEHAPTVRKWVLPAFRNYILFYEARSGEVALIRLLHGARQLAPLIPGSK